MADAAPCPHCGTPTPGKGWKEELCPACLLGLALSPAGPAEGETVAGRDGEGSPFGEVLAPGRVLGGRYRIRESLGRGGMGEVWRGFDLKLRVDVALKAVRRDRAGGRTGLEGLRREVRMARQVVSPNVCRVFDLVELDGRELVSMEFVDGATLAELLRERSPLPLGEAQEIASQLLAGLGAIHDAGLVHRDLKPENVMLTRAGRVVVMDLGIAHWAAARAGALAGTPPYMPPEQARGEAMDLRADLFAAGVLLAEMVAPGGIASDADRRRIWDGVAEDPPRVDETPWAAVLRRAVAPDPGNRHESAAALARELEEVTQRAMVGEDVRPYPGLASFGTEDSDYFYGRELEVEALWRKLRRPGLFALIGPSGAGKSSFLRAGLLASRPPGWEVLLATPGNRPLESLTRAVRPEVEALPDRLVEDSPPEESEAVISLLEEWGRRHEHALVVVDQFEELFTLNPEPIQKAFVALLRRLTLETDVHVLLAMRDDFLFRCQGFEELAPVFADLTPHGAPTGASLRRAIVQPALRCGYRFEDEALVESMIAEVEKERGALPLLAFACSQLWELRDRERGLLTRAAYEEIGGVSGALARHADATLGAIGRERDPIVREILRNLVTPQGTRIARDREELLSVFAEADRAAASEVLDALVASRLLVSFEASGKGESAIAPNGDAATPATQRSVEIVHESLLTRWPSLVRWRAQDAEGAVLREQLRQAAALWERHVRAEDFLWTGTAYREFRLWRERYPGGLTALEEDFAAAMTSLSQRRRRRRRAVAAAGFALLAAGLGVVSVLRQRAVAEMHRAEAEALRAEASKVLALGEVELAANPTAALAYAIKSLELDDSHTARLLALRALAAGPPATLRTLRPRETGSPDWIVFSPDGAWAVLVAGEKLHALRREDGSLRPLEPFPSTRLLPSAQFDAASAHLFAARGSELRVWGVPEFSLLETQHLPGRIAHLWSTSNGMLAVVVTKEAPDLARIWQVGIGRPAREIASFDGSRVGDIDAAGSSVALARGNAFSVQPIGREAGRPLLAGSTRGPLRLRFHPTGDRLAVFDTEARELGVWAIGPETGPPPRGRAASIEHLDYLRFDASGRRLALLGNHEDEWRVDLLDLRTPLAAAARSFPAPFGGVGMNDGAFTPDGRWLATVNLHAVSFWPMRRGGPIVLRGHRAKVNRVRFTPDGSRLVSIDSSGQVRTWELREGGIDAAFAEARNHGQLDVDPRGRFVAFAHAGGARVMPLDGGEARELEGFDLDTHVIAVAVDADGRRVAAASFTGPRADKVIRVWELETDEVRILGPVEPAGEGMDGQTIGLGFLADGRLASAGDGGVRIWSIRTGDHENLAPCFSQSHLTVFGDGHRIAYVAGEVQGERGIPNLQLAVADLATREARRIPSHGIRVFSLAVDPKGAFIVTGSHDGIVRVGPVSGGEPHLLIGHQGWVSSVDVSPDGRWIASAGADRTLRVWPVPDLSEPPWQSLSLDELLSRLKSLTNLRVVADSESTISAWLRTNRGSGYELDLEPFPGWGEAPQW